MKIISRKEAKAAGLSRYFTGEPCGHGFIAERETKTKKCVCESHKAMRAANANKRYLADRDSRLAKAKKYAEDNAEQVKLARRDHYIRNREAIKQNAAGWAESNRESRRKIAREWAKRNRDIVSANNRKRQARKQNATPAWFGEFDDFVMKEAYDLAKRREAATGIKWEVDHIVPLAGRKVCGLHVGGNIQVIPMAENRKKSNRHVVA